MELALFDPTLNEEYYQSEVSFLGTFYEFQEKTAVKNESNYTHRTNETGFGFLLTLAHVYHQIPFFLKFRN
jgi:hypothetical protein